MAKTLLGISPGTRILGIAVVKNGELVEWRVKTFREKWSRDKEGAILSIIEKICAYYEIQVVSIKKIDPLYSSPQLERLQQTIVRMAKRRHIKVVQYSLSDLDFEKRNTVKESISEHVANRHPELRQELLRERNNRREYYTKMFEAIAMAERCDQ